MIRLHSLLGLLIAIASVASAEDPVRLNVRVDRTTAQVVEPIEVTIEVTAPSGTVVLFPERQQSLGSFGVRNWQTVNDLPLGDGNRRRWTTTITIDSLQSGEQTIPPLEIHYHDATEGEPDRQLKTLLSEPIEIRIVSLLEDRADPTDFRDIKQVVDLELPVTQSDAWIWWTGSATAVVLAMAAAILTLARRRPIISPADGALAEITQLEWNSVDNDADSEAVLTELTDVVRRFIESAWRIPATTLSTRELLTAAANHRSLSEGGRRQLQEFLLAADEVKFARLGTSAHRLNDAFGQARRLVQTCQPGESFAAREAT